MTSVTPVPENKVFNLEIEEASILADQIIVAEEVNFNTAPSDDDYFEESKVINFPKPPRQKTELNVFKTGGSKRLKGMKSFASKQLAEKMKSLLSHQGS